MKDTIHRVFLVIALLALPFVASADDQLVGVGVTYWSVTQTFNGTDASCVTDPSIDTTPDDPNDGGRQSGCALFPAGTSRFHISRVAIFQPTTSGNCYWTGDQAVELGTDGALDGTDADAENDNTVGARIRMSAAGMPWHEKASRQIMRSQAAAGARDGLCPNAVASGGDVLYAPCSAGATCSAAHGGGTCVASPSATQIAQAGMIANCEGGEVSVTKQRVPNLQAR